MVISLYCDHITRNKHYKNFCVTDYLYNFLNLSLNLKRLRHMQFHITISLKQYKQFSLCLINFLNFSVPVSPYSVSFSFSNAFLLCSYFDSLHWATQFLWKTALFFISNFANSFLSLNRKHLFFNVTGRVSWKCMEIYFRFLVII